MGCCEPTKAYIINNGHMRTHNNSGATPRNASSNENWLRSEQNMTRRKGNRSNINEYDEILANDYHHDLTLQMKELQSLPIVQVADCYQQPNPHSVKAASSVNPTLVNTVYSSDKGRKCYETTYPKLAA